MFHTNGGSDTLRSDSGRKVKRITHYIVNGYDQTDKFSETPATGITYYYCDTLEEAFEQIKRWSKYTPLSGYNYVIWEKKVTHYE